jgi:drug/metabolite transporter (DMT)-like permease
MSSLQHRGSFFAITSGFLYGFIGYFGISVIHSNISITNMLFWRFLIASAVILLVMLPQLRRLKESGAQLLLAFLSGAVLYCFSTMLFFYASNYIGSGLAMVIFFSYPVMVIVFNYFFYGQTISRLYYIAASIVILGMFLFIDMHEMKLDLIGIALGTISALFYAAYIVASKKSTVSPTVSALMVSLGCMLTALICTLVNGTWFVPTSTRVWMDLFGIGAFATAIPILLLLYSLKYINSEKASLLSVLEPVFVVIFGVILLGETLEWQHVLGVVVVLFGAILTLFSDKIHINKRVTFSETQPTL